MKKQATSSTPWTPFVQGKRSPGSNAPTHVSLFAGAGGTDLGLKYSGFKTVFANDFDQFASQTFRHNLDSEGTYFKEGDVTQIDFKSLKLGHIDLLTGGFPCQPFSNAGARKGTSDERGKLYQSVIDAVTALKPSFILLENVRGITTSMHEGRRVVDVIMDTLSNLGYHVSFKLIDASHYNVGQRRLRLFIAASRYRTFTFPQGSEPSNELTMGEILSVKAPASTPNLDDRVTLSPQTESLLKLVPIGGSWKDVAAKYPEKLPPRFKKILANMKRYHAPKFYRKFSKGDISGTMTASFTPENSCIWNPVLNKVLTVRDCARIQSFPDWFEFLGPNHRTKHKQIGNAIPPRLAYELGLAIKTHIGKSGKVSSTKLIPYDSTDKTAFQVNEFTYEYPAKD